jgi:hypothetical protein
MSVPQCHFQIGVTHKFTYSVEVNAGYYKLESKINLYVRSRLRKF